jgi:maleylpyruvate isomerase
MSLILHAYWRSGTSYRTRMALNLKGLDYQTVAVNLRAGDQHSPLFKALNPQGLVPALETGEAILTQSPAILEWLEEQYPQPPLLPSDLIDRATVRAMAAVICCDIHPLNNLRVLKQITSQFGADDAAKDVWTHRWIHTGFEALELMISQHGRDFCFGDSPTLADCCLAPQIYSAERFGVDLSPYPRIRSVAGAMAGVPAIAAAHPDVQPEAE